MKHGLLYTSEVMLWYMAPSRLGRFFKSCKLKGEASMDWICLSIASEGMYTHVYTLFSDEHRPEWAPWQVYADPYATDCIAQSEPLFQQFPLQYVSIGSDKTGQHLFTSIKEPWLLSLVSPSLVFIPRTDCGRSWPLQTENIAQEQQLLRPSLQAIRVYHQKCTDSYTFPLFLPPTHQLQRKEMFTCCLIRLTYCEVPL